MPSVKEISDQVRRLRDGHISLEDFGEWSADYAWNIHKRADEQTRDLAHLIRSVVVAFESGDLSETSAREELDDAIGPLARQPYVLRFPPSHSWVRTSSEAMQGSMVDLVGAAIS